MAEDFSESGMPNGIMVPAFRRNMNPEDRYGSLNECKIIDENVKKITRAHIQAFIDFMQAQGEQLQYTDGRIDLCPSIRDVSTEMFDAYTFLYRLTNEGYVKMQIGWVYYSFEDLQDGEFKIHKEYQPDTLNTGEVRYEVGDYIKVILQKDIDNDEQDDGIPTVEFEILEVNENEFDLSIINIITNTDR